MTSRPRWRVLASSALRRAVRRHHDGAGLHLRDVVRAGDPFGAQAGQDLGVVHQVAENGERTGVRVVECQVDRVAYPKHIPRWVARMMFMSGCPAASYRDGHVLCIAK